MSTQNNFNQLSDAQLLELVLAKMNEFHTNKKSRTFFKIMQGTLNVTWAGTRELHKKFGLGYRRWFPRHGANINSKDNLIALTSRELVVTFVEALHGEYKVDKKLGSNISEMVSNWMNKNATQTIVDRIAAEAAKLQPIMIQIGAAKPVKMEGLLHKKFEKVLRLAIREKQVFIAGPAGTGKTTLAAQVAKALKLNFSFISCTAGMSEAHLLGRMNAHGDFMTTDFIESYENGGVFLFDEVDAADSNTMLIINSALANGHLSIPNRIKGRQAKRHKDFYCICAANTWGYGSSEYAGRNVLDAAFLDRFVASRVLVEYDHELESKIGANYPNLVKAVWEIRKNVFNNKIRRICSTRTIVSGVRALIDNESLTTFIQEDYMCGWTQEERAKALNNVALN